MTKLVCSVNTCAYNKDHYCSKSKISVDGSKAEMPSSTCCKSFTVKNNGCCNDFSEANEMLEVSCDAEKCMYNNSKMCTANKIGISGSGAKNMEQTECASFRKE